MNVLWWNFKMWLLKELAKSNKRKKEDETPETQLLDGYLIIISLTLLLGKVIWTSVFEREK